jgi:hypothetical protein
MDPFKGILGCNYSDTVRFLCPNEPGLGCTKKKPRKFSEFWQSFLTSENSTDSSNCVPSKNSRKKLPKFCQLAAPKTFQQKFFFPRNANIKFSEFVVIFFRTQIFSVRT